LIFSYGCGNKTISHKNLIETTDYVSIYADSSERINSKNDSTFLELKGYLADHETGWYQPIGTYPTPVHTVSFMNRNGELNFPLWIGVSWIGTRVKFNSYVKNLNSEEVQELEKILDLEIN